MDIYIAGTRAKLMAELQAVQDKLAIPFGVATATIYGKANATDDDVNVHFTNEDMEGRPEVADEIFVEVEK